MSHDGGSGLDSRESSVVYRGSRFEHEWYAGEFRTALAKAGITDYVRPFHDARHASLTNGAAAGEAPIALMTRAGHRSMSTTNGYLYLAGVVFRDEAAALERRLGLGTGIGTDLSEPERTEQDANALSRREPVAVDLHA